MPRILVVDDEPAIREVTRMILEGAGYEVVEAEDGETGLKVLEGEKPDLILLDIMLPGIDGWDVCKKIKADKNLKDIPIAVFTVKERDEDIRQSLLCNAEVHIAKPFDEKQLLGTIAALLEKASSS